MEALLSGSRAAARRVLDDAALRVGAARSRRLIVGAGPTRIPGWIASNYPAVDVTSRASLARYFRPGSLDAILAEHVWEHLTPEQALAATRNCRELLAPAGRLRIAVPDGLHGDPAYLEAVRPGGSGPGSDDHKVLYTHRSLRELLESAGFSVTLLEWFDEHGRFHAEDWDPKDGLVSRSTRFDQRNATNPTAYTSLIADARP